MGDAYKIYCMARYSYRRKNHDVIRTARNRLGKLVGFLRGIEPGKIASGAMRVSSKARSVNGKSIPDFVRKNLIDSLSFKKIFLAWITIIIAFGFVFSFLEYSSPGNGLEGLSSESLTEIVLNSIYFSFITATSTGFGDITPLGMSRFISVIEAVTGLLMFGIVISKLVSFKQETILKEIYDISFEEKVNRLRSALYLPRSDMDNLLHRFSEGRTPRGASEHLWSAMNSVNDALMEIQRVTCIKHSKKREFVKSVGSFQMELIFNSVNLTLNKLNELLGHMNEVSYNWRSDRNTEGIKHIISTVEGVCNYHRISQDSPGVNKRISEIDASRKILQSRLSR